MIWIIIACTKIERNSSEITVAMETGNFTELIISGPRQQKMSLLS
jgi:hypothetical protein